MAIKYLKKFKDKTNRNIFFKNEKKLRYYKFMRFKYEKLFQVNNVIERKKALLFCNKLQFEFQKVPNTKITNYCILTGRAKGVYRSFKLSRHQVKQNFKFLTGLRNSSF